MQFPSGEPPAQEVAAISSADRQEQSFSRNRPLEECAYAPIRRIMVTGSAGLVGSSLTDALSLAGFDVRLYDLRSSRSQDILDEAALCAAMAGCVGVVHLAAVSRVVWGERDPARCWRVNVDGLKRVINTAARTQSKPWLLFASSREVYGNTYGHVVTESIPIGPVNNYGRTKAEGERLVDAAHRDCGLRTSIIRLSNVYGRTNDHADRVIPAFVQAALEGRPLSVEGWDSTFDFTHVDDVVFGLLAAVRLLESRESRLPTVHLATGSGNTLGEVATKIIELADSPSRVVRAPKRTFDVQHFVGDTSMSAMVLGFTPRISLDEGLRGLIKETRKLRGRCFPARSMP